VIIIGCDIHSFYECKIKGRWVYIGGISVSRNYLLFSVLANVRNYEGIECVSGEAKGLPNDISRKTLYAMNGRTGALTEDLQKVMEEETNDSDHHSHSYLDWRELEDATKIYNEVNKDNNDFPKVLLSLKDLLDMPGVEDVRFVFCFDN
jgi:hypothetical protein